VISDVDENVSLPVMGIQIRIFLGLPDPDPLVKGIDPDPAPAPDPSLFSYILVLSGLK
jgi:hypothetical protein